MFSDPAANVAQLGLQPNEIVADLGSGSGVYALAAAKVLNGTGRVYAVEIQKDLVARIQSSAREAHLGNIQAVWGHIEERGGTKVADQSVDAVILSNVLFQTENKDGVMVEVARILRPGGRMLLIDWTGSFGHLGPHPDHVFTEAAARTLLEKNRFIIDRPISAGNYHWGLLVRKGGQSFATR